MPPLNSVFVRYTYAYRYNPTNYLPAYKYSASENDLTDFTIQREKDFLRKQNVTVFWEIPSACPF